jgi:hypothetical protein
MPPYSFMAWYAIKDITLRLSISSSSSSSIGGAVLSP